MLHNCFICLKLRVLWLYVLRSNYILLLFFIIWSLMRFCFPQDDELTILDVRKFKPIHKRKFNYEVLTSLHFILADFSVFVSLLSLIFRLRNELMRNLSLHHILIMYIKMWICYTLVGFLFLQTTQLFSEVWIGIRSLIKGLLVGV